MSDYDYDRDDFRTLWSRELVRDLSNKRDKARQSFDALKNPASEYGSAHRLMLRLYDVALTAVHAEIGVWHKESPDV